MVPGENGVLVGEILPPPQGPSEKMAEQVAAESDAKLSPQSQNMPGSQPDPFPATQPRGLDNPDEVFGFQFADSNLLSH